MAIRKSVLPDTMVSPETGETLTRGVRPFVVVSRVRRLQSTCRATTPLRRARACMSEMI